MRRQQVRGQSWRDPASGRAEAEANAVSAEVTAAVGLGQLCGSITPELVDKIAPAGPRLCAAASGLWLGAQFAEYAAV